MLQKLFYHFGRYLEMLWHGFAIPERTYMYWKETIRQIHDIGIGSLLIVALISLFIGAVTALQFAYQLDGPWFHAGISVILSVTSLSLKWHQQ